MSAAAVIDLETFRQQRREKASAPAPTTQLAWQPVWVWFWVPVR